ncbi:MAG TPA: hypothetical protein DEF41_05920 [Desulfovibrio sp.]|uniref:Uncharacterized protein n=1 Tax=Nitratidesulfovibrio vulgaris (strain ATCC 29579 / DSM 644 / CCUG 34227 / NCIMB 8303 / VKM B-1760 / Hildenborough) TaxID=882 RepID=Q72WQ4_NITV2|nr:hypothetical protein DVUA0035 [Nitratidesulfovibrio vulgaris str. Hildenborough]HBW15662.1 hypothetical protein [Desulfovibrio sp.]
MMAGVHLLSFSPSHAQVTAAMCVARLPSLRFSDVVASPCTALHSKNELRMPEARCPGWHSRHCATSARRAPACVSTATFFTSAPPSASSGRTGHSMQVSHVPWVVLETTNLKDAS